MTSTNIMDQLDEIHHLLSNPIIQQILHTHPNDSSADAFPFYPSWRSLLKSYLAPIPLDPLLLSLKSSQIPRHLIPLPPPPDQNTFGMSPKKAHEVHRMVSFISSLALPKHTHIVDVGAGQAYLTRALHDLLGTPALALDSDLGQTHGALRRGGPKITGITHKTIRIDPETLVKTVDSWLPPAPARTPVLLVALHACGSLTPDILRAALSLPHHHHWYPAAIVAVGCCYNLMNVPADFPLCPCSNSPDAPPLPASAYQLAAQIPSTWLLTPAHSAAAELAVRKVVWRALLGRLFLASPLKVTQTGSTPAMRRLGRLNDAAYESWGAFLKAAELRIGIDLSSVAFPPLSSPSSAANPNPHPSSTREGPAPPESEHTQDHEDPTTSPHPTLAPRLASLHLLRCLLGPVLESAIILDRVAWLRAEISSLAEDRALWGYGVDYVNLFDQATGSARNVAIVVLPGAA
ncbi:hypothetical protein DXG01_001320 [Tephrocybe rancida]|nr:hypothetical protein DXG01_001320 [Tephrocybe rancida]